jgi:hypothetical protein
MAENIRHLKYYCITFAGTLLFINSFEIAMAENVFYFASLFYFLA